MEGRCLEITATTASLSTLVAAAAPLRPATAVLVVVAAVGELAHHVSQRLTPVDDASESSSSSKLSSS
jgi:hypothetical protein